MCKLKDDYGVWLDNQQDIIEKFILDYTTRFEANQVGIRNLLDLQLVSRISHKDNMKLIKIPDMEEVTQALFSIDLTKTLRPDGFGASFFKHCWNVIKQDFYKCISEFFTHRKIL